MMSRISRYPRPPSFARHLALAGVDFRIGLKGWRAWLLLGMNDIRQRYRRSRIGQFWITISMAVTIVTLGILYAYLFKTSVKDYVPYLAVGMIAWGAISSIVTDSCVVFTGAEMFLRQVPMPKTVFVHRMLVRNMVMLAHNAVILPVLFLVLDVPIHWQALLVVPGLLLIVFNGVWIGLLVGTLCARFRDMPQMVNSLMQIVFYLTPVMWKRDQIAGQMPWLTDYNPFACLLAVIRDPLIGAGPRLWDWAVVGLITVLGYLIAVPFFARFRARIIYWL
ncbi:MAG: ABC transporter permease [Aliidongia sp.]